MFNRRKGTVKSLGGATFEKVIQERDISVGEMNIHEQLAINENICSNPRIQVTSNSNLIDVQDN